MAKYIMPYNSEIGEKEGYARFAKSGGYLDEHLLTLKR